MQDIANFFYIYCDAIFLKIAPNAIIWRCNDVLIKKFLAQREALEKQIATARRTEIAQGVQQVRTLIAEFQHTQDDIFGGKQKRATSAGTVVLKYRDPATGQIWTGRGKAPA